MPSGTLMCKHRWCICAVSLLVCISVLCTSAFASAMENHQPFIHGCQDGTFKPDQYLTKAEFAVMWDNYAGSNTNPESDMKFDDVKKDDWFYEAVMRFPHLAFWIGIGGGDGKFHPEETVSRGAFVEVVVRRVMGQNDYMYMEEIYDCSGILDLGEYYNQALLESAAKRGIIFGDPDGRFRPNDPITRAEAVTVLNRARKCTCDMALEQIFSDVPETHWAYHQICHAAVEHKH